MIGMTLVKAEHWLAKPGTVGVAVHGKLHVCGPEGEELGPDQDGLIFFENDILPTYHNDPAKTAEAMHPKGWMTLGDIGHLDADGFLFLTDRKSHMIISGGVNIYPQEIENLLVTHPKVMDAAVIGAPCPDLGEKVVAVVQPKDMVQAGPDLEAELRDFLAPSLSKIKMPKLFDFRPANCAMSMRHARPKVQHERGGSAAGRSRTDGNRSARLCRMGRIARYLRSHPRHHAGGQG
jgi:fatty-acyl-CoA synthase